MVHIAIIGDIHNQFSVVDVDYFNQSKYDLLLCVGDLGQISGGKGYEAARLLSGIQKPLLFIPGNHDTVTPWQLLAEIWQSAWLARLTVVGQARRAARLQQYLGAATWCGYSTHSYVIRGFAFDVIAARPFSMGGPLLSFLPHLRKHYGVNSLTASAALLRTKIDAAQSKNLIFLAHNGPSGLGSARESIWGCDFRPEAGDFGDPDLQEAIAYAQAQGHRVRAVVAGHMHHHLKGGGQRQWLRREEDTLYINAARVPRVFTQAGEEKRHHIELLWGQDHIDAQEVLI